MMIVLIIVIIIMFNYSLFFQYLINLTCFLLLGKHIKCVNNKVFKLNSITAVCFLYCRFVHVKKVYYCHCVY